MKAQDVKDLGKSPQESSIEEKIPESQGDLADRAGEEIESDLQWRIELIRRANKETYEKRLNVKNP